MSTRKRIALVAHDERKNDLIDWAGKNTGALKQHELFATGTTGKLDILIFFWDPMAAQPHDVDVKALLRMAVLYNVPSACNRATADYMVLSELFSADYTAIKKDYSKYLKRFDAGS